MHLKPRPPSSSERDCIRRTDTSGSKREPNKRGTTNLSLFAFIVCEVSPSTSWSKAHQLFLICLIYVYKLNPPFVKHPTLPIAPSSQPRLASYNTSTVLSIQVSCVYRPRIDERATEKHRFSVSLLLGQGYDTYYIVKSSHHNTGSQSQYIKDLAVISPLSAQNYHSFVITYAHIISTFLILPKDIFPGRKPKKKCKWGMTMRTTLLV